jgi:hypothetical protein
MAKKHEPRDMSRLAAHKAPRVSGVVGEVAEIGPRSRRIAWPPRALLQREMPVVVGCNAPPHPEDMPRPKRVGPRKPRVSNRKEDRRSRRRASASRRRSSISWMRCATASRQSAVAESGASLYGPPVTIGRPKRLDVRAPGRSRPAKGLPIASLTMRYRRGHFEVTAPDIQKYSLWE